MSAKFETDPTDLLNRMSPAALALIDQYTSDQRRRILDQVAKQHAADPNDRILASDVKKVTNEPDSFLTRRAPRTRPYNTRDRLRIVATVVAVLALFALYYWILAPFVFDANADNIPTAAIVGAGLAAAFLLASLRLFFPFYLFMMTRSRRRDLPITFVRSFQSLERRLRLAATDEKTHDGEVSLGRLIFRAEMLGIWSPEQIRDFRQTMAIRNSIVHDTVDGPDSIVIREAMNTVDNLSEAIGRWQAARSDHYSARGIEAGIAEALARLLPSESQIVKPPGTEQADLYVDLPNGDSCEIYVKKTRRVVNRDHAETLFRNVVARRASSHEAGIVLIVTSDIAASAYGELDDLSRSGISAELVQWGVADDGLELSMAVRRAAERATRRRADLQNNPVENRSARFEVRQLPTNEFLVELLAGDGTVLAVGQAFRTRREAEEAARSIASNARSARIEVFKTDS